MEEACLFKIKGSRFFTFFSITKFCVIISAEQSRADCTLLCSALIITLCPLLVLRIKGDATYLFFGWEN
jgi:hypothetical protein